MSFFTKMSDDDLQEYVEGMLVILDDWNYNITDLEDRWNYITDINTNEIRPQGRRQAEVLAKRLENIHRKLDKNFYDKRK